MKSFAFFKIFFVLTLIFTVVETPSLQAEDTVPTVVYFYIDLCEGCQMVDEAKIVESLEAEGIEVIKYDLRYEESIKQMSAYSDFYQVPQRQRSTPLMFAGEEYFHGGEYIIDSYNNGTLSQNAYSPLLEVGDDYIGLQGFSGLLRVIGAGLIDSVNPCAIAMLLMFISLVGVLNDRKIMITIALSYIGAIFITYFVIGLFLFNLMQNYAAEINAIQTGLYIFFIILCLFLFLITFYDYQVTKNEQYGKVKNQLPKIIQSFNKRFMKKFTDIIHEEDHGIKRTIYAIIIPFIVGIVVAFTEAACTGQVYGLILISIRTVDPTMGIIYLLVFNLLFVTPLIIIALIAIISKNIIGVSTFIREKMPVIKFVTSIFFLFMVFYFLFEVIDFSIIHFVRGLF